MDLTETEEIKKWWQEHTEDLYKRGLNDQENLGSKITAVGDCIHEIKRCMLLGRKAMTNLDSLLKSRGITLPTKVCVVKAMVFPIVTYVCNS